MEEQEIKRIRAGMAASREKLEEYDKLYPKASLYLRSDKVPANLLQKTGFANVNTVKRLIAEGHIKGNIERIETKDGTKTRTTVDITSNDTKNARFTGCSALRKDHSTHSSTCIATARTPSALS